MSFIAVDYETLERRTMATAAKTLAKYQNFGSPGGIGSLDIPGAYGIANRCKRCGEAIIFGEHQRRRCHYRATNLRYQKLGYVPVTGLLKKALKQAGVPMHWGTGLIVSEGLRPKNLRRGSYEIEQKRRKSATPPEMQKTYYAPVWAVLLYDMSGVGSLTSPKRPKVKELMDKLRRTHADPDEAQLLMTEHILGKGPYTVACQALLGRSMR